jgi:serine/threonine-protein kinase HipA
LSTAIDWADTRASVDTLMDVAQHFRLEHNDALAILAEVARATTRWHTVASKHGLRPRDIEEMAPAFEHPEADKARQWAGHTPASGS